MFLAGQVGFVRLLPVIILRKFRVSAALLVRSGHKSNQVNQVLGQSGVCSS